MGSLARALGRRGYRTAAFVGNWTLRDRISGLGEHFQQYDEVFTRKRWLGLFKGEATGEDLTEAALAWLDEHQAAQRRPFLLWVHYVEPHAPYRLHAEHAGRLGIPLHGEATRSDRYDTEVAFADREAGRLLDRIERDPALAGNTLVVFTADHGESLGEHGDWGHGRTLYEAPLRIPLGFAWPGRLRPQVVESPALILDVAPTVLSLVGLPVPEGFRGFDWSPVLTRGAAPPLRRAMWFEAHKGAVLTAQERGNARRKGLLEVARIEGDRKEIYRLGERVLRLFDLVRDPGETRDLAGGAAAPSGDLQAWLERVGRGLTASDRLAPADLDAESLAKLRALGYAD
jgi:arylsulfatase A-like enzyme